MDGKKEVKKERREGGMEGGEEREGGKRQGGEGKGDTLFF